jgi:hypothetical protein
MRKLTCLVIALMIGPGASSVAASDVEYVKRSELWAYDFGQQMAQGAQRYGEWNGHLARREADHSRLAELKKALAACNNTCPDRQRLNTETTALEGRLRQFDNLLCGTFRGMRHISTPERDAAIVRLLRIGSICPDLAGKDNTTLDREFFEKQRQRIAAGNLDGYFHMGMRHLDDPDKFWPERSQAGCAVLYRGAVLGNGRSTWALNYYCLPVDTHTEEDRKAFVALLRSCSERGENICTGHLADLHMPAENMAKRAPFPPDEREALRLWDVAAARGDESSATSALRLRRRMEMNAGSAAPDPAWVERIVRPPRAAQVQAETPPAPPSVAPRAVREATGGGQPSAYCKQLAEIVERNRQAAEADASKERRLAASKRAYAQRCRAA